MKKLMVMAVTAAAAFAVQASAFNWNASGESNYGKFYNTADAGANYKLAQGTTFTSWTYSDAFMFVASATDVGATTLTQTQLLTLLNGDGGVAAGWATAKESAIATTTLGSGSANILDPKDFNYGDTGFDYNMYMAILATDGKGNSQILISDAVKGNGLEAPKTATIDFETPGGTGGWTKNYSTEKTFDGAGWYAVGSAVPEPTSGLLLLLGVAGLALRRRYV